MANDPSQNAPPTVLPSDSLVPLEAILCTEELNRRPSRPPDYQTENRALAALVQALADSPRTILQSLADKILEVFQADSAGISLLTKDGGKRFYWPAIAGLWKPYIGGGTPREFGPCGDVLDRNASLLFRHFERRYTYFLPVTPPVEECLLVPFYVGGKAVGTIWAITHDDNRRKFDAEDLRQLESLGRVASAAYQTVEFLDALEQQGETLRQSHTELAQHMAELQKVNREAQDSRRDAFNLMKAAVQSRQAMESLNVQLRESEERLERTVAERTRDLRQANTALLRDLEERKKLEEQLLQAQKMESIGTLAGGIAHDFNNVLNIIQAYAFALKDCAQNEDSVESLKIINDTIRRGSSLVQQLLTLAHKTNAKFEELDVNSLIGDLTVLISQTFPKTIKLSLDLERNLPPIILDKNQFGQALLNLSVNARDAMPDGGSLTLKTSSVDGASLRQLGEATAERYVCVEVTDTGMGIDKSSQKRIFEPFFTTKEVGQGTGLGLSVVYGIVKNHKGFIDVQSEPMSGTSFRVYFAIGLAAERPAADMIAKPISEPKEASNGAATVLLVEDEKIMLDLLEKVLLQHGYQIFTATDGEKALEIYRRHKQEIDIVVLDIGLPKVAGKDVLLQMKQQNPDVKLVVASGYIEPELKSYIDQAGIQHFIHKPYSPDEILKTLQSLMEEGKILFEGSRQQPEQ